MFDPNSNFIFVIDTDSYAGNFEREMCASLTGHVGECGVGSECVDDYEDEEIDFDNVEHQPDDHGCSRPVTIYPSPVSGHYNSVAILFGDKPTDEQIKAMKDRAVKYGESNNIKINGFRLIERVVKTTEIAV